MQKAISLENNNAVYWFYLALASDSNGDVNKTIEALRKAIEFNPKYSSDYNYLGYYLLTKTENYEESLTLIQKAVDLEPDNAAYQDSLGWAYFKLNQSKNAKYHLGLALQLMTEEENVDPVVLDHLGDLYFRENDTVNALEYWEKSLELHVDEKEKEALRKKIRNLK